MHIGQTFQSCLMHSAHWLPSTTNKNWVARFPVTFKYLQIYTYIDMCYFLKVNLLQLACVQYGYYFSLICSLLYEGSSQKHSGPGIGFCLLILTYSIYKWWLRLEKLEYTAIHKVTITAALQKPVVLIYNRSGKHTERLSDLYLDLP